MIGKILAGKVITGIAYSLIGSETARKALTVESIHKAASAVGRTAATTCLSVSAPSPLNPYQPYQSTSPWLRIAP